MRQSALTVITPIRPADMDALRTLLEDIGLNIDGNPHIPFGKFTTTHFCRWVILPEDMQLAFESNYDGELDAYFDSLIALAGPGLDLIYSKCEGFPAAGSKNPAALKAYLKENCYPAAAYYIAYRGETFESVRSAIAARNRIQQYLDEVNATNGFAGRPCVDIVKDIKADLVAQKISPVIPKSRPPELMWGLSRFKALIGKFWVKALLVILTIFFLPVLVILLVPFLIWWALLRWNENRDTHEVIKAPVQVPYKLVAMEDRKVQNQMTHIVSLRPGLFRQFTMWIVFYLINLLAIYVFNEGSLGNIPTIHFARWVMLKGGKRVLFFSNFDGSWENYLGDFIDKASKGLTAVWSNTEGFPKATNLLWDGALDEVPFKNWTRMYQVHTQVWFSAYPDDSVRNILNDLWIRDHLWAESISEADAKELLQRL